MFGKFKEIPSKLQEFVGISQPNPRPSVSDLSSESTGNSEVSGFIPLHPPPDLPTPDLASFVNSGDSKEEDKSNDDFRTSFSEPLSQGHSVTIQRIPPVLSTPATHLPTFEERILQLTEVTDTRNPTPVTAQEALLRAAKANDEATCEDLLDLQLHPDSVNPNYQDEDGKSALHWAAENGSLEICTLLIDFGEKTDVNLQDQSRRTALHYASLQEHVEVVQFLLRCGADGNRADALGNTPLHYAARTDNEALVGCFLRRNPNLAVRNAEGISPVEIAGPKTSAQILEAIQKKRTGFAIGKKRDPVPFERIKIVESSQEDVNYLMCHGSTPKPENGTTMGEKKCGPEDFDLLQQLGKGSFGEVFLVQNRTDGGLFAMKVLRKDKIMGQNLVKYAMTERNVLSYIRHPFIVSLNAAFQTSDRLFLILDYCPGGDMGWHLSKEKRFNEYRARIYASEILLALEELHRRDIIFRDLKPDNVVFDAEGHAMLTDFGLSKEGVYSSDSAKSFCGSIAYLAPEMLKRQGHGKAVDWYLLGVLVYEMLVGAPPYFSRNRDQLFQNIQHGVLRLPSSLSTEAKSLIRAVSSIQLLERQPLRRLGSGAKGADEIKQHPFFQGISWDLVIRKELRPPVLPRPVLFSTKVPEEKVYGPAPKMFDPTSYIAGWSFVSH